MTNSKHFAQVTKIAAIAVIFGLFATYTASIAQAASFSAMSDTLTRLKTSTVSSHTIKMTMAAANTFATGETITVDFGEDDSHFSVAGAASIVDDFDITTVKSTVVTEAVIVTPCSAGANNIGFSIDDATGIVTFTACASFTATDAASQIVIEYGSAATNSGTGTDRVTNPATAVSHPIILGGTIGDSGTLAVGIVDNDQVDLSASVDPSLTFDIDDTNGGDACVDQATPYAVAFGTIATTDVEVSGAGDAVSAICLDTSTNATGGLKVTVVSKNASLKSSSVPADTIASAGATMSAGTANYGLCVSAVGNLASVSPFNGTCALNSNTNTVGAVTTSAQPVVQSTGPVAQGTSIVAANAAISATTRAHNDYTDQLTFIATGTF